MYCLEQATSVIEQRPEGFDPESFDSLVRTYQTTLMRVAYRITGQREDAEDVVQETFLRVYEKMGASLNFQLGYPYRYQSGAHLFTQTRPCEVSFG